MWSALIGLVDVGLLGTDTRDGHNCHSRTSVLHKYHGIEYKFTNKLTFLNRDNRD